MTELIFLKTYVSCCSSYVDILSFFVVPKDFIWKKQAKELINLVLTDSDKWDKTAHAKSYVP